VDREPPKHRRPWELLACLAELAYPGARRPVPEVPGPQAQTAGPADQQGPRAA